MESLENKVKEVFQKEQQQQRKKTEEKNMSTEPTPVLGNSRKKNRREEGKLPRNDT